MASKRLPMRKAKNILKMKWELHLSHREVSRALGVSCGAVSGALERAREAELTWAIVSELSEEELEARLYTRLEQGPMTAARVVPDWAAIEEERHKPGVTLALLHLEYREQHPEGYGYTQFCEHYRRWMAKRGLTMRMEHLAGDKLFVDYSGKKPKIVDPDTGVERQVELFIAVFGASNYTFAEATETQRVADFIASHVRAFAFFGGVPAALVPDRLKSAVIAPGWYEPEIQRTYEDMAEHYGTAVVPTRARKPRDKAKVEVSVQVVQRWILARLRKERFFSLDALNRRIAELLADVNARTMRRYGTSRRERFDRLDRPALRALPTSSYELAIWSKERVRSDYHVTVDRHAYSVPHTLVGQLLEMRSTAGTVEILRLGKRVAAHVRSHTVGEKTTCKKHMPLAHQRHLEWTPERIGHWAASIGSDAVALTEAILAERPHPEQGFRSCLGLMRLERRFGAERLNRACRRALKAGARACTPVERMLVAGLDLLEPTGPVTEVVPTTHENVRGPAYYA